jgi:sec-independent protein translocase protein TatB
MLSIPHLVIIFLVALVVLGPEKLPQVARMLGKAMADFRRVTSDFRVQIEDEMREMERQALLKKEAAAQVNQVNEELVKEPVLPPQDTVERSPTESATLAESPAPVEHASPEPSAPDRSHPESEHTEKPADGNFHPA